MPFADEMIGEEVALRLAEIVDEVSAGSGLRRRRTGGPPLAPLTLRARVDLLSGELTSAVGGDYGALSRVVRRAQERSDFTGWMIWPVTEALARAAVADGDSVAFDDALELLAQLTGRLTSEFAIRQLMRHDLERVLMRALEWTRADDHHVRRLASEGTRPYLPWAVRVPGLRHAHDLTIPILDALHDDPSEYVRRSVANHLNDLSRDDPDLVVEVAERWMSSVGRDAAWVVRHGLRTLLKRGDRGALALQGFESLGDAIDVDGPHLDRDAVSIGEQIELHALIRNTSDRDARVMVDYVVHHLKANGTLAPKVFKLTTALLPAGETLSIRRAHSFREITTRRYHPGPHAISLQVNGDTAGRAEFVLTS